MTSVEGREIEKEPTRVVAWFSAGAASAVSTKLLLAKAAKSNGRFEVRVVRILIPEESLDNDRFAFDCEKWFGQSIVNIQSDKYEGAEDVWTQRRYMSGVVGAPCTQHLKKDVRKVFTAQWHPDLQVFGYTCDERDRAETFRLNNPER